MNNKFWGYIHVNGQLQVKRYFDKQDIDEAKESPFVAKYFGPVEADNIDMATDLLKRALKYC